MQSSKKFLVSIIFTSLLSAGTTYSQMLFTPFENESSFKGSWNLSMEVPNYIAAYFREFYKINVLSSSAFLSLAEKYKIDESNLRDIQSYSLIANEMKYPYLVVGKIIEFNVSRFGAGESNIAGYEAYNCNISITIQIHNILSSSTVYTGTTEVSISNKGLGLNLFGAQSDDKKQYLALNTIKFGSEEFNKTIVGETILQLCTDLAADIKFKNNELLYPKKENKNLIQAVDKSLDEIHINVETMKGQLLTYDGETGEAFINLGASNNLRAGDELTIYAPGDSLYDPITNQFLGLSDKIISSLIIKEIRGEKLSLGVVKTNHEAVKKGMEIREQMLRKAED